jgi:hypothetical protein
VCPACQAEQANWIARLDRCARCGSTRLSLTLGDVTCRQCGFIAGATDPTEPTEPVDPVVKKLLGA